MPDSLDSSDRPDQQTDRDTPRPQDNIPDYLIQTYYWAYLNPRHVRLLDRPLVVNVILWGNARRLMTIAAKEFTSGQHVLQASCVYGGLTHLLLQKLGNDGSLDVVDVAPVQLANLRRKLPADARISYHTANLAQPGVLASTTGTYDSVCCFFLLHEVPEKERAIIVHNLLEQVAPGGKIVFVDYHRMHRFHPLRPIMSVVFHWLEPYALSLLPQDITTLSVLGKEFSWHKETLFGGLYQYITGTRNNDRSD